MSIYLLSANYVFYSNKKWGDCTRHPLTSKCGGGGLPLLSTPLATPITSLFLNNVKYVIESEKLANTKPAPNFCVVEQN